MSNKRNKKKKTQKPIAAPDGIAVPEPIAEEIRGTLIGRLQLNLWEVITGQKNLAPTYKQILRYLRKTSLRSASIGEMEHAIFYGKKFFTTFEELHAVDVSTLLEQLEDEPWPQSRYLELSECPDPLPATLGVVVSNGALLLPGGGRVYVVTFLNEAYPQRVWARMEVRASRANPDRTFSKLTHEGWKVGDPSTDPLIQLAVCCLQALQTATPPAALKYVPVGAEPPEPLAPEPETPADPEYDRRLALVYAGKMPCALVRVPLADVRPYRAEFAFEVPRIVVDRMVAELRGGVSAPMLLYWKAPSFIVSDDYALYLAERELRRETIEAVVMGEIPPALVPAIVRRGGSDLIPGALYMQEENYSPGILEWKETYRRANKPASSELIELHLLHLELAGLLQQSKIHEREIQRFIETHPIVLDAYGAEVRSEVRLGQSYRVDLVLQYADSDRRILLVELESPTHTLFTAGGRWNAKITHAIQQVQDWMRWWREHPQEVPAPFDATIPVKGLVIAGRDKHLDESAKRRLLHNNHQFHDLSVITYDDLLRRLDRLMSALGF